MQTLISSCNPFMSNLQVTSEWDVCFPLSVTRQHTVNRGTYGADLIWGKIKWVICFPLPTEGFKWLSTIFLKLLFQNNWNEKLMHIIKRTRLSLFQRLWGIFAHLIYTISGITSEFNVLSYLGCNSTIIRF